MGGYVRGNGGRVVRGGGRGKGRSIRWGGREIKMGGGGHLSIDLSTKKGKKGGSFERGNPLFFFSSKKRNKNFAVEVSASFFERERRPGQGRKRNSLPRTGGKEAFSTKRVHKRKVLKVVV